MSSPESSSIANNVYRSEPLKFSQAQSIRIVMVVVAALSGITGLGILILLLRQPEWQLISLSSLLILTALYSTAATLFEFRKRTIVRDAGIIAFLFGLSMLATSAFLANLGIAAGIIYLVFTLILSSTLPSAHQANRMIVYGILTASGCAILSNFSPFPQIQSQFIIIYTPAILGVLFMIYVVLLAMQYVASTLRIRLVTVFLAVVILPLAIMSFIQSRFLLSTLREEKNNALLMASQQAALRMDAYLDRSRGAIHRVSQLDIFRQYLELPPNQRENSPEEIKLRESLRIIDIDELNSPIYMSSYAVIDDRGINVFDTFTEASGFQSTFPQGSSDPLTRGKGAQEGDQDYFKTPFRNAQDYISPVFLETQQSTFFYISSPIKNKKGEVIGVLRMRNDGLQLQDLAREFKGLTGSQSYVLLVDENNVRLADSFTPQYLYKAVAPLPNSKIKVLQESLRLPNLPASMVTTNYPDFARALDNAKEIPVFNLDIDPDQGQKDFPEVGAIVSLNTMPWKIVFLEKDFNDEVLQKSQRSLVTLVTTLIAAVVGLIAVGISQLLSYPIVHLTQTAQSIAEGNLSAQAPADSMDEFGLLGSAFNTMTRQVRTLINELEERVNARTYEIEKQNRALVSRARQLQTVADVARHIVSVQELENLFFSVTHLISERFGFYHVGVFLLDANKEFAILRASNSAGGQRMLARNHMLPVGRIGIVGYVTGTGLPRIALDVGGDAVFFNNPDLPTTRSEMALPLKVGAQIIGALDIQSEQADAFHEEDIELFNTLADQVAIAIYNNELYTETARALRESQTLHRQYLHEEWEQEVTARKVNGYIYNRMGVTAQQINLPEWNPVLENGTALFKVTPGEGQTPNQAIMAVPINVRGETLGVIHVQDSGQERFWSEDEIAVVNDVANQVAVALENARLFEATARRADHEKKVLDITAQIRSTNEPERMIQIAVQEIRRALGATRAQIYVRPAPHAATADQPDGSNGSNGQKYSPEVRPS